MYYVVVVVIDVIGCCIGNQGELILIDIIFFKLGNIYVEGKEGDNVLYLVVLDYLEFVWDFF